MTNRKCVTLHFFLYYVVIFHFIAESDDSAFLFYHWISSHGQQLVSDTDFFLCHAVTMHFMP